MSNIIALPAGQFLPASAPKKAARIVAKSLFQLAGESALASGKVTPAETYAFGLGLAIIGATDNNAAPFLRIKALMGEKPNKKQSERLQYWANCTAAGRANFAAGDDAINIGALLSHHDIDSMSAAALAKIAQDTAARAAIEAEKAENAKRIEETLTAAQKEIEAAARVIQAAQQAAHNAAYGDVMAHGATMDNGAAVDQYAATVQAASMQAALALQIEAEKAAALQYAEDQRHWLAKKAAEKIADMEGDRVVMVQEFTALAEMLGVVLTKSQLAKIAA